MNHSSGSWSDLEMNSSLLIWASEHLGLDHPLVIFTLNPLIIVTNLAVLLSSKLLLCFRKRPALSILEESRNVSLVLLGNLALADIVLAVLLAADGLSRSLHDLNSNCTIKGLILGSALTSSFNIFLIALDRYFFIVHCLRYDHYMSEHRARLLIYLSWVLGLLIGFLPLYLKALNNEDGFHCRFINEGNSDIIILSAGTSAPSMIATYASYMAIYRKAKTAFNFSKIGNHRLKRRSLIIVLLSSSCYCLTGAPYLTTMFVWRFLCNKHARDRHETCKTMQLLLISPLPLLGLSNSLINPIIFAWWHRPFTTAISTLKQQTDKSLLPYNKTTGHNFQLEAYKIIEDASNEFKLEIREITVIMER